METLLCLYKLLRDKSRLNENIVNKLYHRHKMSKLNKAFDPKFLKETNVTSSFAHDDVPDGITASQMQLFENNG